jgi:hypothetical protein
LEKSCSLNKTLLAKLIDYLCNNYTADIHLEGGELFLEESLVRFLSEINASAREHITVTTNGTIRLTEEKTLEALRSIACLRISVEGHTEEMQQYVRGCKLETVLNNAHYYKECGIHVILRITLNTMNYNSMFSKTIPELIRKGFEEFQIYEMQPVGRAKEAGLCIESSLETFFDDWLSHLSPAHITVLLPRRRALDICDKKDALQSKGITVHETIKNPSVSINADASMRICAWDMESQPAPIIIGDDLSVLEALIGSQNEPHQCGYCSYFVLEAGAKYAGITRLRDWKNTSI